MNELNNLTLTEIIAQSSSIGYSTNTFEMRNLKMDQPSSVAESTLIKQEN